MSFTFEPALGVLFECAVTGNVLGLNNLISTFCLQSAVSQQITVLSGGAESPSSSSPPPPPPPAPETAISLDKVGQTQPAREE